MKNSECYRSEQVLLTVIPMAETEVALSLHVFSALRLVDLSVYCSVAPPCILKALYVHSQVYSFWQEENKNAAINTVQVAVIVFFI